ncbi:MAG: replication-relaxation family protein [Pseudomonadota bacterium]
MGLFFIQRYRFLTIDQYARAASVKRATASDQLRSLERHGILGHFGNVGLRGHGKTPKVYFLKRKGYELLLRESDIPQELIGPFKEAHTNTRWSPQMYHRLHTVDLMIAAETAVRERANLSVVATFLEYRRVRVGNRYQRETTDLVADENVSENRIIPDAALIIENIETGRRALFFIEMDMGTERIVTRITGDKRHTILHKIGQYDRYLQSGRYAQKFRAFGDFSFFTWSARSDRLLTR